MIGLDTNVLVRYITQDDPEQAALATRFIEHNCSGKSPGFINHIVVCELVWVLKRCYKADQGQSLRVIEQILCTVQLQVQDPQVVWKAVRLAQKGKADFADVLIAQVNMAHDCRETITFDAAAAETNGMNLVAE